MKSPQLPQLAFFSTALHIFRNSCDIACLQFSLQSFQVLRHSVQFVLGGVEQERVGPVPAAASAPGAARSATAAGQSAEAAGGRVVARVERVVPFLAASDDGRHVCHDWYSTKREKGGTIRKLTQVFRACMVKEKACQLSCICFANVGCDEGYVPIFPNFSENR